MGEHLHGMQKVAGSSPAGSTLRGVARTAAGTLKAGMVRRGSGAWIPDEITEEDYAYVMKLRECKTPEERRALAKQRKILVAERNSRKFLKRE